MLLTAMSTTATGLQAAGTNIDAVSNNIANSNTPGYKAGQVSFQDLLYTSLKSSGGGASDPTLPNASQIGYGVGVGSIRGKFSQGSVSPSGGVFDLAITGEGFFRVTQRDGSIAYTRAGNFSADQNGRLVSSEGLPLADDIVVPAGTANISVDSGGTVTATDSAGGTQTIGQLTLTRFQNVNGLNRVGDNSFVATAAAGPGVTGAPGTNALGTIDSGSLEQSNVELASELINLVVAQQAFTFNTRVLTTANEMVQSTLNLFG